MRQTIWVCSRCGSWNNVHWLMCGGGIRGWGCGRRLANWAAINIYTTAAWGWQ